MGKFEDSYFQIFTPNINEIINNNSSKVLFQSWWEDLFNKIYVEFNNVDSNRTKVINYDSMKLLKQKLMELFPMKEVKDNKNALDIMNIESIYLSWKRWFKVEYDHWDFSEIYEVKYWDYYYKIKYKEKEEWTDATLVE